MKRNVAAQEEVVSALWRFASSIGAPITSPSDGLVDRRRLDAVGPALADILEAFGCEVTPLQ
jgi:hypothetical protein